MTLPASGAISFNDINVELGVAGTTQASLGQASFRALAGVASGAISMSDFYGKSSQFAFSIASNQTNANLATLATAAGWNGASKLVATINSGVYVSSNTTGTPGLTVSGSFPGGVELINNGFIIGMGGAGGTGASGVSESASGNSGGLGLSVSSAVSIRNNGTIGGGGGGGGGGGRTNFKLGVGAGGGGGGGRSGAAANSSGGAGGSGSSIAGSPGGAGTVSAAGSGGLGGLDEFGGTGDRGGQGGSGGGLGSSGSGGESRNSAGAGGGAGGAAVSGNSNITWLATGTRLGAIT